MTATINVRRNSRTEDHWAQPRDRSNHFSEHNRTPGRGKQYLLRTAVLSANDLIGPEKNPASWARLKYQPALRVEDAAETVHHASLDYKSLPEFFAKLDESLKARALRFTILTAARINEVLGMSWREMTDFKCAP
jgi:hypothetical protein